MMANLIDLLSDLFEKLQKLNGFLEEDQKGFLSIQYDVVEKGNIDKLTLKNSIDELIILLRDNPQWLKQEEMASNKALYSLWKRIQDEMDATNRLMQVNQTIILANQEHYSNMFNCLVNAMVKEEALVYNQQAELSEIIR